MNWDEKLQLFLKDWQYHDHTIGILVCGSYITGSPSSHSDLDVHMILEESVDFRERGNRYIDGLLIEYFANTPAQIRAYFKEDYAALQPMSQTQFATGKILLDTTGEVHSLKTEAQEMLHRGFSDLETRLSDLELYGLWDMLDDLQDLLHHNKEEFDFVYYINLDKLLSAYMRFMRLPYHRKTILGHINQQATREKYLLQEIADEKSKLIIQNCITCMDKQSRLANYEALTHLLFKRNGGFEIGSFTYRSTKDIL